MSVTATKLAEVLGLEKDIFTDYALMSLATQEIESLRAQLAARPVGDEREAFRVWWESDNGVVVTSRFHKSAAWKGWQARAQQSSPAESPAQVASQSFEEWARDNPTHPNDNFEVQRRIAYEAGQRAAIPAGHVPKYQLDAALARIKAIEDSVDLLD